MTSQVRPGVSATVSNLSPTPAPLLGTVAAIFQATWGPLGQLVTLADYDSVAATFGLGKTIETAQQAFLGGVQQVLAWRAGSSGSGAVSAALNLKDTTTPTAINAVQLTALYPGTRPNAGPGFNVQIITDLTNGFNASTNPTGFNDFILSEGTTVLQTVQYCPLAVSSNEAQSLVAAIVAAGSIYLTAAVVNGGGNGSLAKPAGAAQLFGGANGTAGADPSPTVGDYTAATTGLESQTWDVLCCDVDDAGSTLNATLSLLWGYIDRIRVQDDHRGMLVVGAPTSLSQLNRLAHATAFNDPAVVYVANGFVTGAAATPNASETVEGHLAAARVAGMISSSPITTSLTHAPIPDGQSVTGSLANSDIVAAINAGAFVFSAASNGLPQVEYAITTLVTPPANLDNGWKKIRRVRTRDFLVESIVSTWNPLIGRVTNDVNGRAALVSAGQAVVNGLIQTNALRGGVVAVDPANPPFGDSAWFTVQVQDNDSAEHIYVNFGFSF